MRIVARKGDSAHDFRLQPLAVVIAGRRNPRIELDSGPEGMSARSVWNDVHQRLRFGDHSGILDKPPAKSDARSRLACQVRIWLNIHADRIVAIRRDGDDFLAQNRRKRRRFYLEMSRDPCVAHVVDDKLDRMRLRRRHQPRCIQYIYPKIVECPNVDDQFGLVFKLSVGCYRGEDHSVRAGYIFIWNAQANKT